MSEGNEPITDDEILYRRIPTKPEYFNLDKDLQPSPLAFNPHENDVTGLSVYRAKYRTPQQVARNKAGKRFYVGFLRASDIRRHGMDVVPRPIPPDDIGHAEIPDLTHENRRSLRSRELKVDLATKICFRVEGPYA